VAVLCRVMQVSRSGFYAWRRRGPDDHRQALLREVREIHRRKRGSYGSWRMARELRRSGYEVGRYQARSLMREAGIEARQRRRWRHTTDSQHTMPVAPNLLNRHLMVAEPNRAWVADITAIWTGGGVRSPYPLARAYAGAWHLVLACRTQQRLERLDYDFERLKALLLREGLTTLQLVGRENGAHFHARDPFPVGGVVEDPATGAAAL
jgi:predicted PhzF superfamily epimerase YddE/YHI9